MIENDQFLTFKVNSLGQKLSDSFSIFFFLTEEYKFRGTFFVIDIFWKLQFFMPLVYYNHAFFQLLDFERMLIYHKIFIMKKRYLYFTYSNKLPCDAEVAEKIFNVIYSRHALLFKNKVVSSAQPETFYYCSLLVNNVFNH